MVLDLVLIVITQNIMLLKLVIVLQMLLMLKHRLKLLNKKLRI